MGYLSLVLAAPEQVHLSLAGDSGARIMWFSMEESIDAFCKYGTSIDLLDRSAKGMAK